MIALLIAGLLWWGAPASAAMIPVSVSVDTLSGKLELDVPIPPGATEISGWSVYWWFKTPADTLYVGVRWSHDAGQEHELDHKVFSPELIASGYAGPLWAKGSGHAVSGSQPPRVWARVNCAPKVPTVPAVCQVKVIFWFEVPGP